MTGPGGVHAEPARASSSEDMPAQSTVAAQKVTLQPGASTTLVDYIDASQAAIFHVSTVGTGLGFTVVSPGGVSHSEAQGSGSGFDVVVNSDLAYHRMSVSSPATGAWSVILTNTSATTMSISEVTTVTGSSWGLELQAVPYSAGRITAVTAALRNGGAASTAAAITGSLAGPSGSQVLQFYDDGLHSDGSANDGVYGAVVPGTLPEGVYTAVVLAANTVAGINRYEQLGVVLSGVGDGTPPSAATLSTTGTCDGITVSWVAPGDNGGSGQASEYDLRMADSPIQTIGAFAVATHVPTNAPLAAGALESVNAVINDCHLAKYFALRTRDAEYNWSGMSVTQAASYMQCCAGGGGGGTCTRFCDAFSVSSLGSGMNGIVVYVPDRLVGAKLDVNVFDVSGRHRVQVWSGPMSGGPHHFQVARAGMRSGVYFVKASVGGESVKGTVVLR